MLVLSRKPDEKIVFPELDITVEVIRVSGNRVRLGISAPKHIKVLRGELAEEKNHSPAPAPVRPPFELTLV